MRETLIWVVAIRKIIYLLLLFIIIFCITVYRFTVFPITVLPFCRITVLPSDLFPIHQYFSGTNVWSVMGGRT
jgi:hypothetical protein